MFIILPLVDFDQAKYNMKSKLWCSDTSYIVQDIYCLPFCFIEKVKMKTDGLSFCLCSSFILKRFLRVLKGWCRK